MRILITGINGFIGQHLAKTLRQRGHFVSGLGKDKGGVLDSTTVKNAIRDVEVVIHLAALTSHENIANNRFETLKTSLLGTKNVLDAFSKSKKTQKFIYASTGKVYGKIKKLPISEDHPTNPQNTLGKSKLITEKLIDFYSDSQKELVIFRIFNVYGKGQSKNFLIPTILKQLNRGKKELALGDITAKRDYIYINDLVDAFVLAIEKKGTKGLSVYNIATGVGASGRDIVRIIEKIKREKIKIKVYKNLLRGDEMSEEYGSFRKAKKGLGWEPKVDLEQGLRNILTNENNLQAVILAGGKGARIQTISTTVPKVLFPLDNKPLLDYLIEHLKENKFGDVIICTGHLADKVEDYIEKTKYDINVQISKENKPLGTAGALLLIKDLLNYEFFVLFGDIYTTINLQKMLKFHKDKKADVTMALHISDHPYDSTIVKIDKSKKIVNFIEKPGERWQQYGNLTATSLYIMKKSVLKFITKNKGIDFARDVFPKMLKAEKRVFGYVTEEYSKDIGTPDRYKKVIKLLKK